MTTHKTQCPSCQYVFEITDEQLQLKSGYARCGHCKSIFSAIDHLLSTINRTPIQPTPATTKPSPPAKKIPTPPTSTATPNLTTDNHIALSVKKPIAPKPAPVVDDFEIIDNFDSLPNNKVGQTAKKSNDDDSWLTDLLEEANRAEMETPQMPEIPQPMKSNQNNDVSSMLDDLGINLSRDTSIEQDDYLQKIDERFEQQTASQKNLKLPIGMIIIWLLGSVLLMGVLIAQYTIFNLDNLLKKTDTASKIQTVCQIVKCKLPLANIDIIQTNVLTLAPAKQVEQSDIIFTLKNTANEQAVYPNLKISLRYGNNIKAQLLLTPNQYLGNTRGYLMPNQIKAIKLRIDYPMSSYSQANIEAFY